MTVSGVHISPPAHITARCSISPDGRTAKCAAAPRHHMVESLLLHGYPALSTTLSPTVTSWCELLVVCAATGLHTGVQRHCVLRLVSSPQLPHSAIQPTSSGGPLGNVTGSVMSATLVEAATQLSFLEFLQRCNLLIAPPPRPQPSHPTSGRRCADSFTQCRFCRCHHPTTPKSCECPFFLPC